MISLAPALPDSVAASGNTGFRGALRGALRRLSWRVVGAMLAISLALDVWLAWEVSFGGSRIPPTVDHLLSGALINLLMALYIMVATLVADEWVARGAKRVPAYTGAVVTGCAAGALVQWAVHRWLHLPAGSPTTNLLFEQAQLIQVPIVFLEYLIWGSIIVFIYVNCRSALLASARMSKAQVERAEAQRRSLESRLQALQARVEPQFLFNTLARVGELYESNSGKGSQMLDELIAYLRAALPRLRDSASTLEHELELVRAYLNIVRARLGVPLGLDIDASAAGLCARVPSMIVLPLVNQLAGASAQSAEPRTLRFEARTHGDRLRLQLSGDGRCFAAEIPADVLSDIQDRLRALYGERGNVGFKSSSVSPDTALVIEIPYEPADRSDR